MKFVYPTKIDGTLNAPPSKSMMQRAIAASLLAKGTTIITNPSYCNDALAAMNAAEALGATIMKSKEKVEVTGGTKPVRNEINCGESGLCMRMFTPIAALFQQKITLNATGSLLERPVKMIEEPLKKLGAGCSTNNGRPPVTVHGPLKGGEAVVDGSTSSQFLTGLLMALPTCKKDSELSVKNISSRQYVAMTMHLIKKFGISIENNNFQSFNVHGNQEYKAINYNVEGDWSGASFLLVAGAIAGRVEVKGLSTESLQPDKAIIEALEKAGAKITIKSDGIKVEKAGSLKAFNFDATDSPDLFPPLAALACSCVGGTSVIAGANRLKHKESDRAVALVSELGKLGAKISISEGKMQITATKLKGGLTDSHNDHRIAMACAVAGLVAQEKVGIQNPECISKSYPGFFDDLTGIGVKGGDVT